MQKEDNEWEISPPMAGPVAGDAHFEIEINTVSYEVDESSACLSHCLLLLVDAINDKKG